MRASGRTFEPVFGPQRVFRCLLEAVSSPGRLFAVPPCDEAPEEALLRTLLDHETTFRVIGGDAEIGERLERTTGARTARLSEADFALVHEPRGVLSAMKRGTLERPELGATAVYVVEHLSNSGSLSLGLSGPGVRGERTLGIEGLPEAEVEALRASRADYPLGVDVYLVDRAGRLAGLPRSTRMEVL